MMIKLIIAAGITSALVFGLCSTSSAAGARPFDDTSRRPSVSPYLNLLNNQNPNVTNYQSLVRPMVNQNRFNAQQRSAINNLQSAPSSSPQGAENIRSTGHQSAFGNYSHYYPGLKRQ